MTFVISGTVSAQREIGTTSTAASTQEYFKDVKTLKTFFISGEVPATFPKYDNTLDKVGNKEIDESGITALKNVNWTGNIRELRNIIERLVILCGDTITGKDVNLYANPKG